jgi:hypothetical protein
MTTQQEIGKLQKRLDTIEARNKRVESNKAWETSWTRRVAVAITTYVVIGIYFSYLQAPFPWINAIVPTLGFLLSTLSLSLVRRLWEKFSK